MTRFRTSLILIALPLAAAACQTAKKSGDADPAHAKPSWDLADPFIIKTPESAYFDAGTGILFVSNVAGVPNAKDGSGWITKLDKDGKVVTARWVTGLNAPKGLRSSQGTLWVTDIDRVIGIEIATGKITHTVNVKGAKFLNDVAIGPAGEIYASDMFKDEIIVIDPATDKAKSFVKGKGYESPNGLLVQGDQLVVAGWGKGIKPDFSTELPGNLYKIDLKTKNVTFITKGPLGHLDGLEEAPGGGYFVSDWMAGKVYRVDADGKATLLFEGFKGSADIGVVGKYLVIPRMSENHVTAYEIP